jgi:hypothetical protein
MDCLNRLEIQQYLDEEVSNEAKEAFFNHMQNCGHCKSLWDNAKMEIEQTNQLLLFAEIDEDQIAIPTFHAKSGSTVRKKWITYSSIAAGILLIIGVFLYQQMIYARNEHFAKSRMEAERYFYESDLNKLWNEKQSIITVIDADGNLIYINN